MKNPAQFCVQINTPRPPVARKGQSGKVLLCPQQDYLATSVANFRTAVLTLKAELVWRRHWQTRREVEIALFEYINGFYNPRRRHSAIGWKSPVAFEQKAA